MNKVILLGRTGQDPEVKEVGQNKVCKFSLATSESYKKNGEKVTETTWHNLVFWGKQCEILKQYVHKGDQLLVEGKIVNGTYKDKEGKDRWTNEVVCDRFEFVSSPQKESPKDNQGKWQGKKPVASMSDPDELPINVRDAENAPDDLDDLPY